MSETSLDMHCWGQNPVVTAKLQLNGQDRFSEREGTYFSWVQPYQSHTRNPDEGINVYSFALRPAKVRVYAVNYNVLRIMSGMGGLAYSN